MKSFVVVLTLSISLGALACGPGGIMGVEIGEENNLWIPENNMRSGVSKEEFYRVLDVMEKLYAPVVTAAGGQLVMEKKWKDGKVNASAQQKGKRWIVTMYGGLARHDVITSDGFALVVCHELGHHLGGYPTNSGNLRWASNEGQSDYFATTKCFRKYVENDDNIQIVASALVPKRVQVFCSLSHDNDVDIAICQRTSMAGLSLATLLNRKKSRTPLSFHTPQEKRVKRIFNRHPAAQCRLDTYFQGSLCYKGHDEDVSKNDPNQGVCSRLMGDHIGVRPRCWYNPPYK